MTGVRILVVGATGNVGIHLVRELQEGGRSVRVLARDPKRAAERLGKGVEIVAGDLSDPASLGPALRGIQIASLATSPSPLLGEQESNFMAAASAAGLRRLVKLSAFGIEFSSDRIHLEHAESERRLRSSGLAHVIVRPVIFISNLLFDVASIGSGALPSVFEDARMSFVDPLDVAGLMARARESTRPTTTSSGGCSGVRGAAFATGSSAIGRCSKPGATTHKWGQARARGGVLELALHARPAGDSIVERDGALRRAPALRGPRPTRAGKDERRAFPKAEKASSSERALDKLVFFSLVSAVFLVVLSVSYLDEAAFISFRVVDNFVHGHGLRWKSGRASRTPSR